MLRVARKDMIEASDPVEQIENAEAIEPIEPIERTDPIEPIESTEPREPIDSSESRDHSDHFEFPEPAGASMPPGYCRPHRTMLDLTPDRQRPIEMMATALVMCSARCSKSPASPV